MIFSKYEKLNNFELVSLILKLKFERFIYFKEFHSPNIYLVFHVLFVLNLERFILFNDNQLVN